MFVEKLELNNFRNYQEASISLTSSTNIFSGSNGQGKTNLLEAVFLCAVGKSFRYGKDIDLIRADNEEYTVSAQVGDDITTSVEVRYTKSREKSIRVNGLYLRKLGQLMGSIIAVLFSPEDLNLINDGPQIRRKFADVALSQIKPSHYYALSQYNKTLSQKNALLRSSIYEKNDNMLDVYNEQLAAFGSQIIMRRRRFVKTLSECAAKDNYNISNGEILTVSYSSDVNNVDFSDMEEEQETAVIRDKLLLLMEERKAKEKDRMLSLVGPHRDDIIIMLNGTDIRRFGSQGQKRTAVLSLKTAELDLLGNITGRKPILLLDDVFSELDPQRRQSLLQCISGYQTFITCTDISDIPSSMVTQARNFTVVSGTVRQQED